MGQILIVLPPLHWAVEYVGQTDLKLRDREAMVVAGRAVGDGHRPGQALRPAIEKGVHVGRAEGVTRGLQGRCIRTGEEAIVETCKPDPFADAGAASPTRAR